MTAEVVSLNEVRARLLPTPFARLEDIVSPTQKIAAAEDLSNLGYIRTAVEIAMRRIELTNQPLHPRDRAIAAQVKSLLIGPPGTA